MFINLSIIDSLIKTPKRVENGLCYEERNLLNRRIKLFQPYFFSLKQTKYQLENKFQPRLGLLSSDSFYVPCRDKNRNSQILCAQLKNFYYTFQTENQTLKNLKLVLTFR